MHPAGRVPAPARARLGARHIPLGEPAEHTAVRGLPRFRLQTLAGARPARRVPGPLRVGWPAERRTLCSLPLAGTRACFCTRLYPLPGRARPATRCPARCTAVAGRRGARLRDGLVAAGRGRLMPATELVV